MTTLADVAAPPRARLVTRPLLVRFVSVVGTATSFYLLLSAVPLYARSTGASAGLACATTTALTLFSVAAYPLTPRLMARYGTRAVLAGGLLALGLPALALAFSDSFALILAACVVRGAGFAALCVAGGALTVSLIPAQRRGEGLALIGLVSGVPSVAALPLGVWLAGHLGYRPVFAAGGLAALAGLASLPWLPASRAATGATKADGMLAALRNPALVRPAAVFSATTMAIGIIVTFLPLAVAGTDAGVAALALLVQPAAAIAGRWLAGRRGDRRGPAALLAPGVLAAAAGMLALSLTDGPGRGDRLRRGVRPRVRRHPERDPDADVRPGARVGLRRGQRAVEPRLRRRHGPGRGRVRGARPARRLPARVRPHSGGPACRAPGRGKNTRRGPFGLNLALHHAGPATSSPPPSRKHPHRLIMPLE